MVNAHLEKTIFEQMLNTLWKKITVQNLKGLSSTLPETFLINLNHFVSEKCLITVTMDYLISEIWQLQLPSQPSVDGYSERVDTLRHHETIVIKHLCQPLKKKKRILFSTA